MNGPALDLAVLTAHLIRAALYIWALFEAVFLSYLYGMASRRMKKTPIIESVYYLFSALVVLFSFLTVLPIIKVLSPALYEPLILLMAMPVAITASAMRLFRIWSLENPSVDEVRRKKLSIGHMVAAVRKKLDKNV